MSLVWPSVRTRGGGECRGVSMFEQWVFNKASLNVHNFSSVGPITSLELDLSDYVLKSNVYFGLFLTKYHGPCGLFLARSKFEI